MTQMPPPVAPPPEMPMQPHRGVMILVFSILSWVLSCVIFSVVAWVLANSDLRAMAEGRMDPSGEGITKAGKIVAMINVILSIVAIAVAIVLVLAMLALGVFAAASSGGAAP